MNPFMTQALSGIAWVFYANFFEWYWHRYFMHRPRFPIVAYKGHAVVHHGLYKGEVDYFCYENRPPKNILLKPYALPALMLTHLPVMALIDHFVPHTFWGALIAALAYFLVYEYLHWNMHVPRGHFIERFRWFQFLRTHHKLHHMHHQKNFSVLLPLPDLLFGTFATESTLSSARARRDAKLATASSSLSSSTRSSRISSPISLSEIVGEIGENETNNQQDSCPRLAN